MISSRTPAEPLVSVIVIFLNADRFLDEAVQSVFAQSYRNWELLLVDDGSTDGGADRARRIAAAHPDRVKYLTHPRRENRGMSASRNLGLAHAAGPLVALLDADDVWVPGKLSAQVAVLARYPEAGMLYGPASYWHPGEPARDFIQDIGFTQETVCPPPALAAKFLRESAATPGTGTLLFHRQLAQQVGGFVDDFRGMFEDQAFCFKVALQAPIVASPEPWLRYRQHPDSCCSVAFSSTAHVAARRRYLDWCAAYLAHANIHDRAVRRALADERRAVGAVRLGVGRVRRAAGRLLPAPVRTWLRASAS